jgi:ribosomal-protein-alanine N-acetyltransferase
MPPRSKIVPTKPDLPILHTARLRLSVLHDKDAAAVLDYYLRNRAFHQPWFATRHDQVFTIRQQQANLAAEYSDFRAGRALPFWLSLQEAPERIIGRFAFTNIVRGCFDSCFAAYHLDQNCQGSGFGREAGQAAIKSLFTDWGLHRVEANIMPANQRSIALAENLGFHLEGMSPRYLKINGQWEDHLHFVRFADERADLPVVPAIENNDLQIRLLQTGDIPAAMAYYRRNQDLIAAWNPGPAVSLDEMADWQRLFAVNRSEQTAGRRLDLGLFFKDRPQWLAGTIECKNIAPLPFSSCEIGYSIDRLLAGRGLMLETISQVIAWLLARYGFKRITARCASGNERSIRLLEILGFRYEGTERQAVWLQDTWQDMASLALLREDFAALMIRDE